MLLALMWKPRLQLVRPSYFPFVFSCAASLPDLFLIQCGADVEAWAAAGVPFCFPGDIYIPIRCFRCCPVFVCCQCLHENGKAVLLANRPNFICLFSLP